ncbi:nuclear transport factor 2 family protein [Saccharothrix hoggarensis]|uniref:Nuclear transport factor 2 family protein n=1 Tax=Saccharothrix hoggarensis TaxID=913853 RepID=A0ABW3R1T9_9PSEU
MTTVDAPVIDHANVERLRAIYADLPSIGEHAADDVVLHPADRTTEDPTPVVGKEAVVAHEQALVDLSAGTLVMDVHHIVANAWFGAVLGVLRVERPHKTSMPFCGLWRFEDGRIVEHWENAHDVSALTKSLFPADATS